MSEIREPISELKILGLDSIAAAEMTDDHMAVHGTLKGHPATVDVPMHSVLSGLQARSEVRHEAFPDGDLVDIRLDDGYMVYTFR